MVFSVARNLIQDAWEQNSLAPSNIHYFSSLPVSKGLGVDTYLKFVNVYHIIDITGHWSEDIGQRKESAISHKILI